MKRLGDLSRERLLGFEQFSSLYVDPVLVHAEPLAHADEREFRTRVGAAPARFEAAAELALRPALLVTPIRKGPASAFQGQISVGRTRMSDLHFPYARLSKFHAYFTWTDNEPRDYFLTDAGSTNGTFVEGRRLQPKVATPLADRSYVTFGHYHFLFLTTAGLYQALNELASTS